MTSIALCTINNSARSIARLCQVSRSAHGTADFHSFMSHASPGRISLGRYGKGVFLAAGAAAVTGVLTAGVSHFQRAEMATKVSTVEEEEEDIRERCKSFMSLPVTDIRVLEQRKDAMSTRMEMLIMETQAAFCKALEEVDGGTFKVDRWSRKEGGGGISCVMQDGKVFEKAGVNVSVVFGNLTEEAAKQMRSRGKVLKGKDGERLTSHFEISEGSCDTEDWSIGNENSDLQSSHLKIYQKRLFHNCIVLLYFDQINAALVNIRHCFQTHIKKNYRPQTFEQYVEFNSSILMSLPLTARWEYMHEPTKGSKEAEMLEVLRNPKEWI
uniref:coproporphyrinogen oxidase n=1 Tax=Sinocyclocheilus rhinocerous TaxID=307959 RepID=A0A673IUT7_9TELE